MDHGYWMSVNRPLDCARHAVTPVLPAIVID